MWEGNKNGPSVGAVLQVLSLAHCRLLLVARDRAKRRHADFQSVTEVSLVVLLVLGSPYQSVARTAESLPVACRERQSRHKIRHNAFAYSVVSYYRTVISIAEVVQVHSPGAANVSKAEICFRNDHCIPHFNAREGPQGLLE